MSTAIMERFSGKQWKDCCGKGCKECEIAQVYIGEYGKKKGLALLNEDRAVGKKRKTSKEPADDKASGKKGSSKKGQSKKGKAHAKDDSIGKAGKAVRGKGAQAAKA